MRSDGKEAMGLLVTGFSIERSSEYLVFYNFRIRRLKTNIRQFCQKNSDGANFSTENKTDRLFLIIRFTRNLEIVAQIPAMWRLHLVH